MNEIRIISETMCLAKYHKGTEACFLGLKELWTVDSRLNTARLEPAN
jgi:hypothetical protein